MDSASRPGPGPYRSPGHSPDGSPDRSAAQGADQSPGQGTEPVRLTAWVHGHVQGVGFRWWARARALELGLVGTATNLPDGRVEVVAEGPEEGCRRLLDTLRKPGSPGRVRTVVERWGASRGDITGFVER